MDVWRIISFTQTSMHLNWLLLLGLFQVKYSNKQMLIVNMLLYLLGSCKSCNAIVTLLRSPPEIPRTMVPPILLSATFFKPISLMTLFTFNKQKPNTFFLKYKPL